MKTTPVRSMLPVSTLVNRKAEKQAITMRTRVSLEGGCPSSCSQKATKNGYPCVGKNIPEDCGNCTCGKDWDIILDKMIFAFESLNNDFEDQYHSGECDFIWTPIDAHGNETPDGEYRRMDHGPNHTHKFDVDGWKAHSEKIQEGLELFGKHFRSLWD